MTNRHQYIIEVEEFAKGMFHCVIRDGDTRLAQGVGRSMEVAINIASANFKVWLQRKEGSHE